MAANKETEGFESLMQLVRETAMDEVDDEFEEIDRLESLINRALDTPEYRFRPKSKDAFLREHRRQLKNVITRLDKSIRGHMLRCPSVLCETEDGEAGHALVIGEA
tara:strand:+ start:93 stop:410 length:318 start_codon:yes stop_codon:yes gene_type:complete